MDSKKESKQEREERKTYLKILDVYRVYLGGTGRCTLRVRVVAHAFGQLTQLRHLIHKAHGHHGGFVRVFLHRDQPLPPQLLEGISLTVATNTVLLHGLGAEDHSPAKTSPVQQIQSDTVG